MNLNTVATAKLNVGILTATGKCADSPEFLEYLNTAIGTLLRRGDWFQTLFRMEVCVDNDCIVWPRQVGKVRAINICNESVLLQGQWASFLPFFPGMCSPFNCDRSDFNVELRGLSPIFRQIPCGKNWYVRAYFEKMADLGKVVTVYWTNSNGQIVRTKNSDGLWVEGSPLVLTKPYASTSITGHSITRVTIAPACQGNVRLYAYDAENDVLHFIGLYEPGETEPAYNYSKILGGGCCQRLNNCGGTRSVTILAKLNPDPLTRDTDVLQVQNLLAIKKVIQGLRKEDAGGYAENEQRIVSAVEEMNREEEDWMPNDQVPFVMATFGSATLPRARIGFVN